MTPFNSVVAIGGGHGLATLLQALQQMNVSFGAVIATTDNGGSTGRLRNQLGGIAMGDIRHCVSALADDEQLGKLLLDFRFDDGGELKGHNLGNLMLLALDRLCVCPSDAVRLLQRMLDVHSPLLPMSDEPTQLVGHYLGSADVIGETQIDQYPCVPTSLSLAPRVTASPQALQLLQQADAVLVGPGSLLTSLCPSLLLEEVRGVVADKPLGFVCNLASEHGPVGALAPHQQVSLFEQLTALKVNAYLCQADSEPNDDPRRIDGQFSQHSSGPLSGQHHPAALAAALPDLIAKAKQLA